MRSNTAATALSASITAAFLCTVGVPAQADDLYALKDVTTVAYYLLWDRVIPQIEKDKPDDRCIVNYETWRTNTEFVMNQSTKLKFIRQRDKMHEAELLYEALKNYKFSDPARDQASRKADAYNFMPTMSVLITTAVIEGGCFAEVEAKVTMMLKAAQTWTSDYVVLHPTVDIWSSNTWWKGPQDIFNQSVLSVSDNLIKKFVNAVTAAQQTPWWGK